MFCFYYLRCLTLILIKGYLKKKKNRNTLEKLKALLKNIHLM